MCRVHFASNPISIFIVACFKSNVSYCVTPGVITKIRRASSRLKYNRSVTRLLCHGRCRWIIESCAAILARRRAERRRSLREEARSDFGRLARQRLTTRDGDASGGEGLSCKQILLRRNGATLANSYDAHTEPNSNIRCIYLVI